MELEKLDSLRRKWTRPNAVPRELLSNPELYPLELERIFHGQVWHPVAHQCEIPEPCDFKTIYAGDVPIIINRSKDGEVGAFLNACAHRGTMVEPRIRGKAPAFHCPYHRWTYDSRGRLTQCPGQEDFPSYFRREDFGLKRVRAEQHAGIIFVTFHPDTPPLVEYLGEGAEMLSRTMGGDDLKLLGYQKANYECNWKVYIDQDGFHAPLLHAAFRLLNWQGGGGSIISDERGDSFFFYASTPYQDNGFLKDPSIVETRGENLQGGGRIASLFPITLITCHLDVINVRFAFPTGPDSVEVQYAYFARQSDDDELLRHRIRQSANLLGPIGLISFEDAMVFIRLQNAAAAGVDNHLLKGVHGGTEARVCSQNSEYSCVLWWQAYRKVMGFDGDGARPISGT